jgi:hypothetical protein
MADSSLHMGVVNYVYLSLRLLLLLLLLLHGANDGDGSAWDKPANDTMRKAHVWMPFHCRHFRGRKQRLHHTASEKHSFDVR